MELESFEALFESLKREGLKVELQVPSPVEIPERFFEVQPVLSREEVVEMAVREKTKLFAGPLGFRKPAPEEVELKDVKEFFRSYWYLKGRYECKWLNEASYPIPVPDDVIAIKFKGEIIKVKKEALTIADMFDKIGLNIGFLSLDSRPLISAALKAFRKGGVIGSKRHIVLENVVEARYDQVEEEICLSARTGEEDKEALELIAKANLREIGRYEAPKISKEYALEKLKEKFRGIDEKIESEAERILERKIIVTDAKYVLVPWYKITFEKDRKQRSWLIRAVDGKKEKES